MPDEHLSDTVRTSQNRFGELLREICEISGFTQGKLSREAKKEYQRLVEQGFILLDDPVGSMEQPTVSKVMAGMQVPTYYQVYIWLSVIRTHYESDEFARICKELDIERPKFPYELEPKLWRLLGFVTPDERSEAYRMTKDIKLLEVTPGLIDHKERRFVERRKQWNQEKKHAFRDKEADKTSASPHVG